MPMNRCRWCDGDEDHADTCPTLGTCAQHQHWPPGWTDLSEAHPDADWLHGRPFTALLWRQHMRDAHGC